MSNSLSVYYLPVISFTANEFDQVALIGGGSGMYESSSFYIFPILIWISSSTPLYQFLDHALSDPSNRTKFTLVYANVSPSDILLRKELDTLQKEHPKTFDIVYIVDKPVEGWTGPTGHINKDLIKKHVASKDLGEKVKVFVCGKPNFDWVGDDRLISIYL